MQPITEKDIEHAAKKFPLGTRVKYYPIMGLDNYVLTCIRSEPWECCGSIIIKISGRAGAVNVTHLGLMGETYIGVDLASGSSYTGIRRKNSSGGWDSEIIKESETHESSPELLESMIDEIQSQKISTDKSDGEECQQIQ
ncbi:TPA: hypothetical protein L3N15_004136 [Vibrio parahaemolyticus]|nr:hypothetical protein [Vibrio parahaemolyticus]